MKNQIVSSIMKSVFLHLSSYSSIHQGGTWQQLMKPLSKTCLRPKCSNQSKGKNWQFHGRLGKFEKFWLRKLRGVVGQRRKIFEGFFVRRTTSGCQLLFDWLRFVLHTALKIKMCLKSKSFLKRILEIKEVKNLVKLSLKEL